MKLKVLLVALNLDLLILPHITALRILTNLADWIPLSSSLYFK